MSDKNANNSSFRGDIQGMRALAVLAVVIYHAGMPLVSGGYVGVDVFFVISGFLITLHLVKELDTEGNVKLLRFYARRVRRLLPAAWLVIVATLVAARLFAWPLQQSEVAKGALASSTYLINMWFGSTQTDYLAGETPNLYQHYWSLAVEEQFYLVWPLILLLSLRLSVRRRISAIPTIAIVLASLVLSLYLTGVSQPWAFFGLPTRMWELGTGGVLAILVYQGRMDRIGRTAAAWIAATGLALVVVCAIGYSHDTPFPGSAALGPVIGAALLIAGGVKQNPVSRMLGWRPMQYIGRISYSLYLWHWPVLVLPRLRGIELDVWQTAVLCAVAVVLADLTERLVERPLRFWSGWTRPKRAILGAVAGTAACALLAAASLTVRQSIDYGPAVGDSALAGAVDVDALPSNVRPDLWGVSRSIPRSYQSGCHVGVDGRDVPDDCIQGDGDPRVALYGDSHAAQLFPALASSARSGDLTLLTATKSACPSVAVPVTYAGQPYTACEDYRRNALSAIKDFEPDVVVVSNSYFSDAGEARSDLTQWKAGLDDLADAVAPAKILLVTDGPRLHGMAPAECASGNPQELSVCSPTADDFNLALEGAEANWADESPGVARLSLREVLCGDGTTCPVVRGNVFVFRDTHHLTTEFAELMAPEVLDHIEMVNEGT